MAHDVSKLQFSIWSMLPEAFASYQWQAGIVDPIDPVAAIHERPPGTSAGPRLPRASGSVAVVPLHGAMEQRAGWFGTVGTDAVGRLLDGLMSDSSVGAVVLDIDSPGGSVYGVPELADKIRGYREGGKPVYAVANSLAASAAYWVGSQATKLYVAPGGQVGSVGVWTAHVDMSQALEAEGYKVSLVSAGKYKTEGNPWEPLGEEARAALQADVDGYYDLFVADVARGRGVRTSAVKGGYGEGRLVAAEAAVADGMADGVHTLGNVLGSLLAGRGRSGGTSKARLAIEEVSL